MSDTPGKGVPSHECDTGDFDRTVCPEPCGLMHSYCATCGVRQDSCAHDTPHRLPADGAPMVDVDEGDMHLRERLLAWVEEQMQALPDQRTPVAHGKAELLTALRQELAPVSDPVEELAWDRAEVEHAAAAYGAGLDAGLGAGYRLGQHVGMANGLAAAERRAADGAPEVPPPGGEEDTMSGKGLPLGVASGGDPGFWDRLGIGEDGLPAHLPMGVTEHGQGPTEPDPAHHYVCWCADPACPLTLALGHAWAAGQRITPATGGPAMSEATAPARLDVLAEAVRRVLTLHSREVANDVRLPVEGGRGTVLEDVDYCRECGDLTGICPTAQLLEDALAHVTTDTESTWYEVEVRLYGQQDWHKTTPLAEGIDEGFPTPGAAQAFITTMREPSGGLLYEDAEWRIVQCTRRVLPPAIGDTDE